MLDPFKDYRNQIKEVVKETTKIVKSKPSKLIVVAFIISLLSLGLTAAIYYQFDKFKEAGESKFEKFQDAEWTCLTRKCIDFISGDKWVKAFCSFNEAEGEMWCEYLEAYSGDWKSLPLSSINISKMASCKPNGMVCTSEALIIFNKLQEGS